MCTHYTGTGYIVHVLLKMTIGLGKLFFQDKKNIKLN